MGTPVLDCPSEEQFPSFLQLLITFCPSTLSLFCFFILINIFSQVTIIPVALLWIISCWTTFFSIVPKTGKSIPAETLPVLNKMETFFIPA